MARSDLGKIALALLAATTGAACHWLVSVKVDPVAAAPIDASDDADVIVPPVDPCGAMPTSPPVVPDDNGANDVTLVFAAYKLPSNPRFPDGGVIPELCAEPAIDLDSVDTQSPDKKCLGLVCAPHTSTALPVAQCDQPGGGDGALQGALEFVRTLPGGANAVKTLEIQSYIERGLTNLLIQLSEYNGTDNDARVVVSFLTSAGIEGMQPGIATFSTAQDLPQVWDGGQDAAWTVDQTSVNSKFGDNTAAFVPNMVTIGFVRDGVVVVPRTGPGLFPTAPVTSDITDGAFMAQIERTPNGYKLVKGRFGARMPSSRILGLVGSVLYGGKPLCESGQEGNYTILRGYLCANLDLPPDGGAPNPEQTCGEISFGVALAAVESRFAVINDGGPGNGTVVVQPSSFVVNPPCYDPEAGTMWCDDCSFENPTRCPYVADAGAD